MEAAQSSSANDGWDTILYVAFPRYPLYWSIISVLLVLDPDEQESMWLSYARMKANIAGAGAKPSPRIPGRGA